MALHGMSESLMRWVALGYLTLPLLLGAVAGLCLLVAAARRSLSGGSALALGGLSAVVVLGMLYAAPGHESLAKTVEAHGISPRLLELLATGYTLLPLFLALVAVLALVIATLRKQLDGATALALGGLGAVIVLATVLVVRGHVLGSPPPTVAREQAQTPSPEYVVASDLEELASTLREEMMELRRKQVVLEERALQVQRMGEQLQRMVERAAALEERTANLQREIERGRTARESMQTRLQELEGAVERASAPAAPAAQPSAAPATGSGPEGGSSAPAGGN